MFDPEQNPPRTYFRLLYTIRNKKVKSLFKLTLLFITLFALTACDDDNDKKVIEPENPVVETPTTIVDVAVSNGNFQTLVAALTATGLDQTLSDTNAEFTVFAPTDAAFALLPEGTIDALLEDTDTLSQILTYHVLSGKVDRNAALAATPGTVETVNGASVGLSLDGDNLLVNTVTVTATDIMADNGIIHVIDAVLMPPSAKAEPTANIVETAVADGNFTTLVNVLVETGLDTALADESKMYTVFAPTDAAFELLGDETISTLLNNQDILSNILLQHVVEGEVNSISAYSLNGQQAETLSGAMVDITINSTTDMLMVGGANVTAKDIYTTNGIIHVIDAVIVGNVEVPAPLAPITEVAANAGVFTTLITALGATGLDQLLADETQQFTVFAPTDAAFDLLPEGTLAALLNDTDALSNILTYHVVPNATVLSDDAIGLVNSGDNSVTMANTQSTALSVTGSDLYINTSKVSAANIMASNGVIHIVDQVILPPTVKTTPTDSIVDVAVADDRFTTLVQALQAANLVDTLADESKSFTVFAPTNTAFSKIPTDVLTGLLADSPALTNVLLQHVVEGEVNSIAAFGTNGKSVPTFANNDISISLVNYTDTTNSDNDEVAYQGPMQMLVGGNGSQNPGFTLYVFDNDLGQVGSACVDSCATNWPPVTVSDGSVDNIPGLSIIDRDDGTKQAAFMGRPLYFFLGDTAVGDISGDGVNNVWWKVTLPQVTLQVQGANVISTDIYTTNGVIHVIDTVITETLN